MREQDKAKVVKIVVEKSVMSTDLGNSRLFILILCHEYSFM